MVAQSAPAKAAARTWAALRTEAAKMAVLKS